MTSAAIEHGRRGRSRVGLVLISLALLLLCVSVTLGVGVRLVAGLVMVISVLAVTHERALAPRSLLGLVVLTILFVPIKRYQLPASLPFNLEFYRLVIAFVVGAWTASLLVDTRVKARLSRFDVPIVFILVAIMLSELANPARLNTVGPDVFKSLTFFGSFIFIYYFIVGVVRAPHDIDFLVRILAGGGGVLGFFAIVESATGVNVFNHLHSVFPVLQFDRSAVPELKRGGGIRVFGSGQHPIAFGAALAILLPLAVYRARSFGQRRWWVASLLILMGSLSTRSRTGIVMLVCIGLVYLLTREINMKRLRLAVVPVLLAIHFALPGTLGTIKASFFPQGGIVAQQTNASVGSGRLATLGPALDKEFAPNPFLGEGFGTRVTTPDPVLAIPNGPILDDEWLGLLLQVGVFGGFAFLWLFFSSIRKMGKAAKRDLSPRGWLLAGTTGGVAGFGVGMFTYDAFSFIQVTFLFFMVLGVGAAAYLSSEADWKRFELEERAAILHKSRRAQSLRSSTA